MELDFSRLEGLAQGQRPSQGQAEAAREKAMAVYRAYQENIAKAEGLRAELLKSAKDGEDARALLMKAVRVIGLMTGDTLFEAQIRGDLG